MSMSKLCIRTNLILILFMVLNSGITAFLPVPLVQSRVDRILGLSSASPNHGDFSSADRDDRVEAARQAFESLIQEKSISLQLFARPLTSVSRRRRQIEIALLDSLRSSDDGLDQLLNLWISEDGDEESASQILQMQEECSTGLVEEERSLRLMMERYPSWAEPVVRLGTVLYYKGRTEESYQMALKALGMKPWHFEAIQLLVLLSLRRQDMPRALFWARRGLPTLQLDEQGKPVSSSLKRRQQWVDLALQEAQAKLAEAERVNDELDVRFQQQVRPSDSSTQHFPAWQ